jgi:hypothetical protein
MTTEFMKKVEHARTLKATLEDLLAEKRRVHAEIDAFYTNTKTLLQTFIKDPNEANSKAYAATFKDPRRDADGEMYDGVRRRVDACSLALLRAQREVLDALNLDHHHTNGPRET